MRHKGNPVLAARKAARDREARIKRMFAEEGMPPEQIAQQEKLPLGWVMLTLEGLEQGSPKADKAENKTQPETGDRKPITPPPPGPSGPETKNTRRKTKNSNPLTVGDVRQLYQEIREEYKNGKDVGIIATERELDYALVFRICKGMWPEC